MQRFEIVVADIEAKAQVAVYASDSGLCEYHVSFESIGYGSFSSQATALTKIVEEAFRVLELSTCDCVFRRVFCSDEVNQVELLEQFPLLHLGNSNGNGAVSIVGQPPLSNARLAIWAYFVKCIHEDVKIAHSKMATKLTRSGVDHIWNFGIHNLDTKTAEGQTFSVLSELNRWLTSDQMTVADNVLRTWFYVHDIDKNYMGLVKMRREFFAEHGLTQETHFITSTGIGMMNGSAECIVKLDTYSAKGLDARQIRYLSAPEYLGSTARYGVTFERGTSIVYGDRTHVYISGTASIDLEGHIVHLTDIEGQVARMSDNFSALLQSAQSTVEDLAILIVYLRNPADEPFARAALRQRFGDVPMLVTLAQVCRPGWLIEIEGMAILADGDGRFANY